MHYFKYLGSKESARKLWENEEALNKYLARLAEFWDEEKQEWKPTDSVTLNQNSEPCATMCPQDGESKSGKTKPE